jgi:S1-C subfamily serine protease
MLNFKKYYLLIFILIYPQFIYADNYSAPAKPVIKTMINLGSIKIGMQGTKLLTILKHGLDTTKNHLNYDMKYALVIPSNYNNQTEYFDNYFFILKKTKKIKLFGSCHALTHWLCTFEVVSIHEDMVEALNFLIENVTKENLNTQLISDKAKILNNQAYLSLKNKTSVKKDENKKENEKNINDKIENNKLVPAASGTGFFVSNKGYIITNHHVIDQCDKILINHNENINESIVVSVDTINDLAILKSKFLPKKTFSVSLNDVKLMDEIIVAGYPLGREVSSSIKIHRGNVTSLAGAGNNYSNFQTDATINVGNSGGPIIDNNGNIVGVAVATWVEEGVQGIHFGIKSSILKNFASSNRVDLNSPNFKKLNNRQIGSLVENATVYIECHMSVDKLEMLIAEENSKKAFFKKNN